MLVVALTAASLILASCGTDISTSAGEAERSELNGESLEPNAVDGESSVEPASPAVEDAADLFPNLDVQDIATGQTVNLKTELAGGELPILLWFWAPH